LAVSRLAAARAQVKWKTFIFASGNRPDAHN
jgi:hypothetical protein